jgi:hypothetical protein
LAVFHVHNGDFDLIQPIYNHRQHTTGGNFKDHTLIQSLYAVLVGGEHATQCRIDQRDILLTTEQA